MAYGGAVVFLQKWTRYNRTIDSEAITVSMKPFHSSIHLIRNLYIKQHLLDFHSENLSFFLQNFL